MGRLELTGVVDDDVRQPHQALESVVSEVREHFGDKVFETIIPRSTRLAEAPSFGKPIIHYDRSCGGAAAYELLTQELLARLENQPLSRHPRQPKRLQ